MVVDHLEGLVNMGLSQDLEMHVLAWAAWMGSLVFVYKALARLQCLINQHSRYLRSFYAEAHVEL